MDRGSSINILYYETFRCMGLTDKNLRPSNTIFHGVVPGKSAYPVGKIALEVVFVDDHDSRSETVNFEVVKIRSPYHALFGRPVYAKFMARPCYVYLQLKMPGHKGTITIHGSRKIALECEESDAAYCNAPDVTFHIRNSNSCLFRRCDMIFPLWLGFCCLFCFCSCHASLLIASCASHPYVFIKLASARSCRSSLLSVAFVDRSENQPCF